MIICSFAGILARRYRFKRDQRRLADGEGPEAKAEDAADQFPIIGNWTLLKKPMRAMPKAFSPSNHVHVVFNV